MASVNLTTHVSGLASGMDTEKIVSDMMKVNRIPLDKLEQSKTINSWKTDAYREINTKIASFRNAMEDLRLEGTFNAQKATSGDSRVDVSMAGTSNQTNLTISEASLAIPATSSSVSFDMKIRNGSDKIFAEDKTPVDITFELNGKTITIDKNSTFDEVIASINSSSTDTNVKAANVGGSLVLTSTKPGNQNPITITNFDSKESLLNITDGTTNTITGGKYGTAVPQLFADETYSDGTAASDGHVIINNTKIIVSSNTFTYDGVQFNLKQDILPTDLSTHFFRDC